MAKKITKYYNRDRAAKIIYGDILIYTYLITQRSDGTTSSLAMAFGTFLTAIAIVLAEIYAEVLGKTIKQRHKLSKAQHTEVRRDAFAIISVSFWPSIIFLLSAVGLYGTRLAFNLSYLYCLILLFSFSYAAHRLAGAQGGRALSLATITASVGCAIIIIKYTVGH